MLFISRSFSDLRHTFFQNKPGLYSHSAKTDVNTLMEAKSTLYLSRNTGHCVYTSQIYITCKCLFLLTMDPNRKYVQIYQMALETCLFTGF